MNNAAEQLKNEVILPYAYIQIINEETMKWDTVARCLDDSKLIENAVKPLKGIHKNLWVKHCYGREALF
jgi:hypothetical protein